MANLEPKQNFDEKKKQNSNKKMRTKQKPVTKVKIKMCPIGDVIRISYGNRAIQVTQ